MLIGISLPQWLSSKVSSSMLETQGMWVRYLGWEDPLEEGMVTHSSILAWKIPWTEVRSNQSILRKSTLNIHWKDDAEAPILWPPHAKS